MVSSLLTMLCRVPERARRGLLRSLRRTADPPVAPTPACSAKVDAGTQGPLTAVILPTSAFTRAVDSTGTGGFFFVQRVVLGPGNYQVDFEYQVPTAPARLIIEAIALERPNPLYLAQQEMELQAAAHRPNSTRLAFRADREFIVELRGYTSQLEGCALLSASAAWDGESGPLVGWPECYYRWPVTRLRAIIIGTTNTCNASCIHCPTNKPLTRHLARGPMDWDLYRKLIDGLCETGFPIDGDISFGLFAEPLIDPLLLDRLRYARERLPHVPLVVYSNGGAATPELGAAIGEYVSHVAFHVEGVSSEVYDDLMRPLRAEHVFPRIEAFIRACPKPVSISCPISRRNVGEFAALRRYWLARGARDVTPQPLLNRSCEKLGFAELSFDPIPVACGEDTVSHFLVDADGAVVVCCGDFEKRNIIGDLTRETVGEALANPSRRALFEAFKTGAHAQYAPCHDCRADTGGLRIVEAEAGCAADYAVTR